MTIEEAEVIEWAIELTNHQRSGGRRADSPNCHAAAELRAAVDRLQAEHDHQWLALIGPEMGVPKKSAAQ